MDAPEQLRGLRLQTPPRAPSATAAAAIGPARGAPSSLAKEADAQPKRRKPRPPKSLLLLLKSFVGLRVRIDLKNDSVIEGVVEEVVHDMDFTMLNACETKPNGSMVRMDEVFVMGKTVLYVHIPDRINITQHLLQYVRLLCIYVSYSRNCHAHFLLRVCIFQLDSDGEAERDDVHKNEAERIVSTDLSVVTPVT